MDDERSDDCPISREQARVTGEQVGRSLRYLGKLRTRMERIGFPPTGKLYRACCGAYNAVHALSVHLHYAAIGKTGEQWNAPPVHVGEKPEQPPKVQ